jgi:hypothetical protein
MFCYKFADVSEEFTHRRRQCVPQKRSKTPIGLHGIILVCHRVLFFLRKTLNLIRLSQQINRRQEKVGGGENTFYFLISLPLPYLFLVDFLG